jgi:hypothetical protein
MQRGCRAQGAYDIEGDGDDLHTSTYLVSVQDEQEEFIVNFFRGCMSLCL